MPAPKSLTPRTPGAQPSADDAAKPDAAEAEAKPELSPEMKAMVDAEVARQLALRQGKPAKQSAVPDYETVEAEQMALPADKRKSVLTDKGWFVPVGVLRGPKD